jgi:Tol biopolymer transport system component
MFWRGLSAGGSNQKSACSTYQPLVGASWGADDTIVFGTWGGNIIRISANGGKPEFIVRTESMASGFPQILPGGKSVLYTTNATSPRSKIMVRSLKSTESKELFAGASARYLPTGHLIYSVGNNLLAVLFDAKKLEVEGEPVSVVDGVFTLLAPIYAVSDTGTLVYMPGSAASAYPFESTLVWVDRAGKEEPLTTESRPYIFPRISPDGTRVALTIGGAMNSDIWTWDLARKILTRLTFETTNSVPLWTADGKRIAYTSEGDRKVYWKAADGTGKIEPLISATGANVYPWAWSADGKTLVLNNHDSADIGILSMEGDRKWKPLLQEKYAERRPRLSPDGRWIAYMSNESGKFEVYVRPFPGVDGGRWQVSTNGGSSPLWSPDGRELFYRNGDAAAL